MWLELHTFDGNNKALMINFDNVSTFYAVGTDRTVIVTTSPGPNGLYSITVAESMSTIQSMLGFKNQAAQIY